MPRPGPRTTGRCGEDLETTAARLTSQAPARSRHHGTEMRMSMPVVFGFASFGLAGGKDRNRMP